MNVVVSVTQQMETTFSPYSVAISEGNVLKYSSLLTRGTHTTLH